MTLKNTGPRAGAEVVQLYVRQVNAPVLRPEKELKHFAKVLLASGEERTVTFTLTTRDFARYDPHAHEWVVDSGVFEILVGGSSRDLPLKQRLTVEGLPKVAPKLTRYSSFAELGAHPRGKAIHEQIMKGMLDATTKGSPAPQTPEEQAAAKRARDTLEMFINEQLLGKFVLMSQGQFSEEMLQGILQSVNQ
jgi:beta-glucosidase